MMTRTLVTLTVACTLFALGARTCSSGQNAGAVPVSPETKGGASDAELQGRWKRLRAEYVRIAAPLVALLERDDPPGGRALADAQWDVASAEIAYKQARTARETAEIEFNGYNEGVAVQELQAAQGAIDAAKAAIQRSESRRERAGAARKRILEASAPKANTLSPADIAAALYADRALDDEEFDLLQAKLRLELATERQVVLTRFSQKKRRAELQVEIAKAQANELTTKARWDLAKSNDPAANRGASGPKLTLDERKVIAALADVLPRLGPVPPWRRSAAEFRAFLDEFEAKLNEARALEVPTDERTELQRMMLLMARVRSAKARD